MSGPEVYVPNDARSDFGRNPLRAKHSLHHHEMFSDAALADLLDRFPREHLYALTMGHDLARPEENRLALHDRVSGAELLRAVRNGRLWLNITRVDRVDARYRRIIDTLYERLAAQVPGFKPLRTQGTLLISSPHAMVYYHVDAAAAALWHLRGRKRIWIYPALNDRYANRDFVEDIFAGVRHEYLPYQSSFDAGAVCYDLEPGQWVTWPQNAPHRVTNLDSLNVSLSTEYFTRETLWRERVYLANRFFRTRLHMRNLSAKETGPIALSKVLTHRVAYKFGFDKVRYRSHVPAVRVDADAPNGVVSLDEEAVTE